MLLVKCVKCQSKIRVKPEFAGRRIKCPKCQTTIHVTESTEASQQEAPLQLVESPSTSTTGFQSLPTSSESVGASPVDPPIISVSRDAVSGVRRRKRRNPLAIWLPWVLFFSAVAGGVWYFWPTAKPPETIVRNLPEQTVAEGTLMNLSMNVGASVDGRPVDVRLIRAPDGAKVDPVSRNFTWTPGEADGPGTHDVIFQVTSDGVTTEGRFRVVVTELDTPPQFEETQPVDAKPEEPLTFSVAARDPDEPSVPVVYSLVPSSGDWASEAEIDPGSGVVKWTPPELASGEVVSLTIHAAEESDAALSSDQIVKITVARFADPVRQLIADLRKQQLEVVVTESTVPELQLPFQGIITSIQINDQAVAAVLYDSEDLRQADFEKIDALKGIVFGKPWENADPLSVFAKDRWLLAAANTESETLDGIARVLDRPVAIVQKYAAPLTPVKPIQVLVEAMRPLYEERSRRPGKSRKLFITESYAEVRNVFSDQFAGDFDSDLHVGLGQDYDDAMEWFAEHTDLKEEFFTAIRPQSDDVAGAVRMLNKIRTDFPELIERYGSLAIATSVVWDDGRGVYKYDGHARRTHSTMPKTLLSGIENFRYLTDAESVMEGRTQFVPWEFLVHLVNHETPAEERKWALQAYLPSRAMFGKCYAEVPYDTEMLRTASKVCRLDGKEYNLANIRQFGGVCAMQGDFAARVGKSLGVPAAYVTGSGRYGGAHAWVMWVELKAVTQRSIRFSLESHGRYRGDHYYVGHLNDPQTGEKLTDRLLELRLQQVGMDAMAKRHADRLMLLYPALAEDRSFDFEAHLDYLSGVVGLNPWNEAAWTALSKIATDRELSSSEYKTMTALLNQLFVNFAAFPDFTLTIFDDLSAFEKDAKKRIAFYYQLLEVYAAAQRPDLAFEALLRLSDLLEQEQRSDEAVQALATAIQKYAEEGQYIPRMLDRLELLVKDAGGETDPILAQFYGEFLPKVPQTRGDAPSEYCIAMYQRAIPVFQRAGQTQLAANYETAVTRMKSGLPQ